MAYTVQSGDNLSKIARQYGMDVRDLIASNPQLANPNLIRPGQRINIPDEPVSPAARAAAGNVLAAAPSVAQVVRTAAGTAPAIAAWRVAPAVSPSGLAQYQASERGLVGTPTRVPLPQGQGRTLLPTAQTTPATAIGPTGLATYQASERSRAPVARPNVAGQVIGGIGGGLGGVLVGAAGGLAGTYLQAQQTGERNVFNLASRGISNVLGGIYGGLQQGAEAGAQTLGQSFAAGNPAFRFQPTAAPVNAQRPATGTGGSVVSGNNIFPDGTKFVYAPGGARYAQLPDGQIVDVTSVQTYGQQFGQAIINAAQTGNLGLRPPIADEAWAMSIRNMWEEKYGTVENFLTAMGYERIGNTSRWARKSPGTLTYAGGGAGGYGTSRLITERRGGGGGGGGAGRGFVMESGLYNWRISA